MSRKRWLLVAGLALIVLGGIALVALSVWVDEHPTGNNWHVAVWAIPIAAAALALAGMGGENRRNT